MFVNAGRFLAALVLAGIGVVLGQLPAHACSCVSATTQSQTKDANDVFTGTITAVMAAQKTDGQRGAIMTYDVEVDRVYKGDVSTSEVQVSSERGSSSCGLGRLAADKRYVFFAQSDGTELSADSCGGTARASDRLVSKVERLLGSGRAPVPPTPEKAVFTMVADAQPESLTRLAAPGVALVLAGLLGLFVVRRLGARG
ncbi:MAG: hypothetical protein JWO76_1687 [Nocardioides sp.]|nr:hypothetical protein [Nocardioides sp.]